MNIALSTIIIFLIFLPGFIFRRFYYTQAFSKQYLKHTFFEVFVSCFGPSLVLHIVWYYFCHWFFTPVDLKIIGQLFTAKDYPDTAFQNIEQSIDKIVWYQITINLFAAFAGYSVKSLIRNTKLDRKSRIFKFQNSWHYLFSGEFFDFDLAAFDLEEDKVEEIGLVFIDALVETKEGTIIYDGILVDYEVNRDHQLEYIVIKEAQRRFLLDDKKEKESDPYYNIPGHIIVLPYNTIKNLNISYYKISDVNRDQNELFIDMVK